jgi:hypothetical protein
MSDYAERQEILQAKANYGFTRQGGAIVDIGWFTQSYMVQDPFLAAVLIYNMEGVYKCYLRTAIGSTETEQIQFVAENGCKLTAAMAIGMFPGKFNVEEYDKGS